MIQPRSTNLILILLVVSSGISGVFMNVASSSLPDFWTPYKWAAWPLFAVSLIVLAVLQIWQRLGESNKTSIDILSPEEQSAALDAYFDKVRFLMQKKNLSYPELEVVRSDIQESTLEVLQVLDGYSKRIVMFFLYDKRLIKRDRNYRKSKLSISLAGADLRGLQMPRDDLFRANLSGANLSGANFEDADLDQVDFEGADLHGANLTRANLDNARLCKANLCGTSLCNANLFKTDLCQADMSGADLRKADLGGSNLCGADLSGVNLQGADLRPVEVGTFGKLVNVVYDDATVWPQGFNPVNSGAKQVLRYSLTRPLEIPGIAAPRFRIREYEMVELHRSTYGPSGWWQRRR